MASTNFPLLNSSIASAIVPVTPAYDFIPAAFNVRCAFGPKFPAITTSIPASITTLAEFIPAPPAAWIFGFSITLKSFVSVSASVSRFLLLLNRAFCYLLIVTASRRAEHFVQYIRSISKDT